MAKLNMHKLTRHYSLQLKLIWAVGLLSGLFTVSVALFYSPNQINPLLIALWFIGLYGFCVAVIYFLQILLLVDAKNAKDRAITLSVVPVCLLALSSLHQFSIVDGILAFGLYILLRVYVRY
ncbi:hypothetical protein KBC31_04885 [Candidatus Saccharibacteria bacterium]|jgi:hypothetical protein|nr:hypothetical protein [Candidatus Saccharibacteria bacterium]